jgi:hypothetical protein
MLDDATTPIEHLPSGHKWEPSPLEIREACLETQSTWTKAERIKRAGGNAPVPWTVPGVACGDDVQQPTAKNVSEKYKRE